MEFKIEAGAKINLLTKEEVGEVFAGWKAELARGIKFRTFSIRTDVAGGVFSTTNVDFAGPDAGFVWAVTRLAISGAGLVLGTDLANVYVDDVTPSKLVMSGLTRQATWDIPGLILTGGSRVIVTGVGTGATGTDVTVSGAAIEVPLQLAWQLL